MPKPRRYPIRNNWLRRKRHALQIAQLQLRDAILRMTNEGIPDQEIAQTLGYTRRAAISLYRNRSVRDAIRRVQLRRAEASLMTPGEDPRALPPPKPWGPKRGLPALVVFAPAGSAPDAADEREDPPPISGEILDPPDVIQLRADALKLRKAMLPFSEIAELLGVSEPQARQAVAEAVQEIQRSEQFNADMHRQLMIEQIDQMIAAIHAPATGQLINGRRIQVDLGAIDRMLKLMQRKAELMGLTIIPAEDIKVKLQRLAEEAGYDIVDLEEIAKDVLAAHKTRLPEFR